MKIGIVGLGKAADSFLSTISQLDNITVEAICVRKTSPHWKNIAARYQLETVYFSYQEFLCDPHIDTVYIALPNDLHYEFAKLALLCKKNVIVEKPMVPYGSLGMELKQIAQNRGLFLFEAMTTYYMPNYHRLKALLPKLGSVNAVQCSFSKVSSRYLDYCNGKIHPVFCEKRFGGALYDMNCYQIALVSGLFDKPFDVEYYPNYGYGGIDLSGLALLHYRDFTARCQASKNTVGIDFCSIEGTRGYLRVDGSCNWLPHLTSVIDGKKNVYIECVPKQNRMQYEFMEFRDLIQRQDYHACYGRLCETLRTIEIMETMKGKAYESNHNKRSHLSGWQREPHGFSGRTFQTDGTNP